MGPCRPFARNFAGADAAKHDIQEGGFGTADADDELPLLTSMLAAQRCGSFTVDEARDIGGIRWASVSTSLYFIIIDPPKRPAHRRRQQ
jgi:hypothetical protein